MDQDRQRAALAIACVCAVVLGATLFPAAGFGANPVPGGTDEAGPGTAGETGDGTDGPEALATESDESDGDSDDGSATRSPDAATATADESPSSESGADQGNTATTTAASADDAQDASTAARSGTDPAGEGGLVGAALAIAAILLAGFLGVIGTAAGLGRHHRRRYPGQWSLPDAPHLRVLAYVRRIPQTSLSFVLFAGQTAPDVLERLASGVSRATRGLGAAVDVFASAGGAIGRGVFVLPRGLVAGLGGLSRGVSAAMFGLPAAFTNLGSGGLFGDTSAEFGPDPRAAERADAADESPDSEPPEPPGSVREAWERLQADLGVGGDDGRTPGQIARSAVDRGVPREPIRSLTRAFRDVRYGGYPDDGERVTTARSAYERIRNALDGDSS